MKRRISVLAATIVALMISFQGFTNSGGSPQNRSGSPASNGNTCATGCHSGGTQGMKAVSITSNIPASGYQANTNYTITVSAINGTSKIGFSASVEDAAGHVGSLSSPGSGAQITGSYVTHTISGTTASGGAKSWTFTWNPGANPPASATVYTAVNFTNGTGGTAGDFTMTQSQSFSQAVSIPNYTISQINGLDANLSPDSLGVNCSLDGVVFTDDFDGNAGYSFYMYDNTGEINVFDFVDEPGGYQANRGDSIRVYGDIAFFRGLLEIQVDSIVTLATGVALRAPRVVTTLDETTESDYIRLNNFSVVTPSQWPGAGSSSNVDITNGTDTLTMRIDSDTDIDGTPVPAGSFDVIGVGSQFDFSAPYDEGYQIFPRDLNDIMPAAVVINGVPLYTISQINSLDANLSADSLGVNCALDGVVFTDDFDGNAGYSFYMYDNTGEINVFDFVDEPGGYQAMRGDSIRVFGDIAFFRGLLEIQVDSIQSLGSGISLRAPRVVSTLDESTESDYIRLNGFSVVTPSQWPASGSSANVDITNGVDTLTMRIDSDTDIDGTTAPTGFFDVIGAGSQFDFSAPYDEGYQIFPRDTMDIIPAAAPATPCTAPFFSEYIEGSSNNKGFEIYNPTQSNLDLGPYKVYLSGNGGSFTNEFDLSGTVASGDVYIVTTSNADPTMLAAADTSLGFPSVAHFNGDDALFLVDTVMGDTVDIIGVIGVDPGSSWTVGTGSTANHTLVRMASVTNGETDWAVAATQWMVNPSNTFSFFGSHSSSCVVPTSPTVNFAVSSLSVLENSGTSTITINITPTATANDSITLQFNPGPGLMPGDGFSTPFPDPTTGLLTLPISAGDDSITMQFTVIDDAITEGTETLDVVIQSASGSLIIGNDSVLSFSIIDNDIPTYTVAQVTGTNANVEPDSLGVQCKLVGTVFTDDFDGNNGYSFYMYDNTGGINIFNFVDEPGGYQVNRGDSIRVIGEIEFYNGLIELQVDSIKLLASGVALKQPTQVFGLDESTESEYIRLNGYYLVDPSTWPIFAGSSVNMEITNGKDTLVMRIDSDTDIDGTPAPTGYFDVIGAGGQFDNSAPYDANYQIFPRDTMDIIPVDLPALSISEVMPDAGSALPSNVNGDWFEVRNNGTTAVDLNGYSWANGAGSVGSHMVSSSVSIPAGESAVLVDVSSSDEVNWISEWYQVNTGLIMLNRDDEFNGFSDIDASGDMLSLYDDEGRLVSCVSVDASNVNAGVSLEYDMTGAYVANSAVGTNGAYTSASGNVGSPGDLAPNISLNELLADQISIYPNPTKDYFFISSANNAEKSIEILNLSGSLVSSFISTDKVTKVNLSDMPAGVYLVKLSVDGQQVTRKLILQ